MRSSRRGRTARTRGWRRCAASSNQGPGVQSDGVANWLARVVYGQLSKVRATHARDFCTPRRAGVQLPLVTRRSRSQLASPHE